MTLSPVQSKMAPSLATMERAVLATSGQPKHLAKLPLRLNLARLFSSLSAQTGSFPPGHRVSGSQNDSIRESQVKLINTWLSEGVNLQFYSQSFAMRLQNLNTYLFSANPVAVSDALGQIESQVNGDVLTENHFSKTTIHSFVRNDTTLGSKTYPFGYYLFLGIDV
jgi:hypothetical protein